MSTMQKNRLLRIPKNVQPPIRRILNTMMKNGTHWNEKYA
jgi:hypothetical protein